MNRDLVLYGAECERVNRWEMELSLKECVKVGGKVIDGGLGALFRAKYT